MIMKAMRMVLRTTLVVAVVSLASLSSMSGASELTREEAKKALDKAVANVLIGKITLTAEQMQRLKTVQDADAINKVFVLMNPPPQGRSALEQLAGSLTPSNASYSDGGQRCLPDASDVRISTGQFVQCVQPVHSDITWQRPGVVLTLRTPVKQVIVEITGIAVTSPTERIVEEIYKLDFSTFPKEIEDALKTPLWRGKDLFRLYDDGWRFVQGLQ
jgi:hypothetical protein